MIFNLYFNHNRYSFYSFIRFTMYSFINSIKVQLVFRKRKKTNLTAGALRSNPIYI